VKNEIRGKKKKRGTEATPTIGQTKRKPQKKKGVRRNLEKPSEKPKTLSSL